MNKLSFVIIGVGNIGTKYAKILSTLKNAELVAAVDVNFNQRKNIEKLIPFFNSVNEFLKAKIPADIVCICSPNGLHPEHTILCLNHGYHVICEKPVALNKTDVLQMMEAEKKSGKKVFAVMQNRYSPVAIWLNKLMKENLLGELLYLQINCFWNRNEKYYHESSWRATKQLGGGPLYTQFSHFVDLLIWLTGMPKNINNKSFTLNEDIRTEFHDSGNISFDIANKGKGQFNYTTAAYNNNIESSLTIIGTKGNVKVGGQYMEKLDYVQVANNIQIPVFEQVVLANQYQHYQGSADKHEDFIKKVIECIFNNKTPEIGLKDELDVINFIEQALVSDLQLKNY